jgi:hypothetical protein
MEQATMAWPYDREKPKTKVAETVPHNPHNTIGFRPHESDKRPQRIPITR